MPFGSAALSAATNQVADSAPGSQHTDHDRVDRVIVTHTDHHFIDLTIAAHPTTTSTGSGSSPDSGAGPGGQDPAAVPVTVGAPDTGTVTTTTHHPFWDVTTNSWTQAAGIHPGDLLHTPTGPIRVLTVHAYTATQVTYDLTIHHHHTYYVMAGSTPVLVHNCGKVDYNSTPLGRAAYRARVASGVGPGRNVAAADVEGLDSPVIGFSKGGGYHSENHILDQLNEMGIDPSRIRAIYSERQPCGTCRGILNDALSPGTPVTWSVPWGDNPIVNAASNDLLKGMIAAAGR